MLVLTRIVLAAAVLALAVCGVFMMRRPKTAHAPEKPSLPAFVKEEYLPLESHTRPGVPLAGVRNIVFVKADGAAGAASLRDSITSAAAAGEYRSFHFVVGNDGAILALVPTEEVAYGSGTRCSDTVSVLYSPEAAGDGAGVLPGDDTYASMLNLAAWLCERYGLRTDAAVSLNELKNAEYHVSSVEKLEKDEFWENFRAHVAETSKTAAAGKKEADNTAAAGDTAAKSEATGNDTSANNTAPNGTAGAGDTVVASDISANGTAGAGDTAAANDTASNVTP